MKPYLENKSKQIYTSVRKSSYNFPSHFHNNVEVTYCLCGAQRVAVGEQEYLLGAGDAVVIFPNVAHAYFKTEVAPTQCISIICNTKLLADMFPELVTKFPLDPFVPAARSSDKLALAFEGIAATDSEAELLGWLYIALSVLLGRMPLAAERGDPDLPSKIIAYIDENFKEDLTIDQLAKAFGYHPSYIAHVFCDQLKISFRRYLGAARAEYAATLIHTSQKSLTEIAYESGCNSLNTLCRYFKMHFSMTPTQYKQSLKETGT